MTSSLFSTVPVFRSEPEPGPSGDKDLFSQEPSFRSELEPGPSGDKDLFSQEPSFRSEPEPGPSGDKELFSQIPDFNMNLKTIQGQCANEGIKYVAGYIAKKLHLSDDSPKAKSDWITLKSSGNLSYPTEKLLNLCQIMEHEFIKFHGHNLNMAPDPIGKLQEMILEKNPAIDAKIAHLYCKVRFFSRLRKLNHELSTFKNVRYYKQMCQFKN